MIVEDQKGHFGDRPICWIPTIGVKNELSKSSISKGN
jgi:hypothetical protein